jgi:hypothetical protein
MRAARRERALTEYISARLTADEGKRLRERTEAAGTTRSEWCRQVILNALGTPPETQLLLSEFLALRALILALHTDALQGHKLTEQRIAAMIQQADARKYAMAENRILAFQANGKSDSGGASKS